MPKRVVFFNHFHNGDIHVSRGLIRQVITKAKQIDPSIQFFYAHKNYGGLIADIPELMFDYHALEAVTSEHITTQQIGDVVYFNTWYGQGNFKHMNRYGLTIDTLYSAFDENCKAIWGFSLDEIESNLLFPTIDYNYYQINEAKNWIDTHPGKKIFVSNGATLSDQAHQFSLTPIIASLAQKHVDKIFILSNYDGHPGSTNIIHSADIIKKMGNDLNENSFISSKCDVIIGKASGTFTFAITQENCFIRNIKFLAFCNLIPTPPNKDFWIGERLRDKINYKSNFVMSNDNDVSKISKIIDDNL